MAATESASNGEPLVLVAPEAPPPPPPPAESIAPSTEDVAATTSNMASNSGLFGTGAKKQIGAENAGLTTKTIASSQQATASTQDQVASIDTQQRTTSSALEPERRRRPKATTTSSGGTGYVAQVASLRSEAEARAELDRCSRQLWQPDRQSFDPHHQGNRGRHDALPPWLRATAVAQPGG